MCELTYDNMFRGEGFTKFSMIGLPKKFKMNSVLPQSILEKHPHFPTPHTLVALKETLGQLTLRAKSRKLTALTPTKTLAALI